MIGTKTAPTDDAPAHWIPRTISKPATNDLHPTMKPVGLLAKLIRNSSRRGDLMLDPFGGSGSTLIACEDEGRKACAMELDPFYCDQIVKRYVEFTARSDVFLLRGGQKIPFAEAVLKTLV